MKYRLVKNLHSKVVDKDIVGIYNPIKGHDISFIHKNLFEYLLKNKTFGSLDKKNLENLVKQNFLIPFNFSEENSFKNYKKNLNVETHLMYLLLTQSCNLNCSYCFEELYDKDSGVMPKEVADHAIDYFFKVSKPERKIIFYGGEPLLNKSILRDSIENIRKRDKDKPITEISIVTNGTLVEEDLAKFFKKNQVNISVSIDGPEKAHNLSRKYYSNKGSYKNVIKGFDILKKAGITPSVSCTIGNHNVDNLEEIAEFFVKEIKPSSVGFNFLIKLENNSNPNFCNQGKASEGLFKAFKILRENGIYEGRIMRRLKPFIENKVYLKECGGYGNQIVVKYNGEVGPCQAFSPSGKFFSGNILEDSFKLNEKIFNRWALRNPLNTTLCNDCPAITLCGGGCAYNAYQGRGEIEDIDKNICIHTKKFLDWIIDELWKKKKSKF